jgi:DNA-binding transcriptional LysR family regulator
MTTPHRIDTHQHIIPPAYAEWFARQGITAGGLPLPAWSADAALDLMDSADIACALLSVSTPGVHTGDDLAARALAREVNDFAASVVTRHPGRFGFFATLTLPDVDGALAEAAYALDHLNADGVVLLTNVGNCYFGDALFVRTGRGLLPTSRASQLAEPVAAILDQIREKVLAQGGFDPGTSLRAFTLCLSDVGSYVLWPRIVQAVRRQAPGVSLRLRTLTQDDIASALETGAVDLAVGFYPGLPEALFQRGLFDRDYVGMVRAGHRLAQGPLTLQQFAQVEQVAVRLASGVQDRIDSLLAAASLPKRQTLEMPSYLMLPPLLLCSDYLAVLPGQLAEAFAQHSPLVALKLPLSLPTVTIRLHWHRRFHDDAANAWLRELIATQLASGPRGLLAPIP